MTFNVAVDGSAEWHFYRKAYRKARWRRLGQRCLNDFHRFQKEHPGAHGLIIVVL